MAGIKMTREKIIQLRLRNQLLGASSLRTPTDIVTYMGAMQAQEYAMAKWAIGLRLPGSTNSVIEAAFNKGEILRTHLLRPTWHFVAPQDIRWLLELSAPRVKQAASFMFRKLKLDSSPYKRCSEFIAKALEGGKFLTREEIQEELKKRKIILGGESMAHVMMNAELEALVCSGPRRGKQFTYASLEERVPPAKKKSREGSLAELGLRYFRSRGPASIADFSTWSGLTVKDCRLAVELNKKQMHFESIEGTDYYFIENEGKQKARIMKDFLMPDYDEYGMSYKNRSAIYDAGEWQKQIRGGNPVFNRMLILDGRIKGTWARTITKNQVSVEVHPFSKLTVPQRSAVEKAIKKYSGFVMK